MGSAGSTHGEHLRCPILIARRIGGVNDERRALGSAQDVVRVHRVAGDPFDGAGTGLGAAGQAAHGPAVTREGRGGRASDSARGADDEGNLAL
jgi:hypothetical protein